MWSCQTHDFLYGFGNIVHFSDDFLQILGRNGQLDFPLTTILNFPGVVPPIVLSIHDYNPQVDQFINGLLKEYFGAAQSGDMTELLAIQHDFLVNFKYRGHLVRKTIVDSHVRDQRQNQNTIKWTFYQYVRNLYVLSVPGNSSEICVVKRLSESRPVPCWIPLSKGCSHAWSSTTLSIPLSCMIGTGCLSHWSVLQQIIWTFCHFISSAWSLKSIWAFCPKKVFWVYACSFRTLSENCTCPWGFGIVSSRF